jgi:alcohol dehydrogenase class IV
VAAAAREAIGFSRDLAEGIGVRRPLRSFGVDPGLLDSVAAAALADQVTAGNPRLPQHSELTELLAAAL